MASPGPTGNTAAQKVLNARYTTLLPRRTAPVLPHASATGQSYFMRNNGRSGQRMKRAYNHGASTAIPRAKATVTGTKRVTSGAATTRRENAAIPIVNHTRTASPTGPTTIAIPNPSPKSRSPARRSRSVDAQSWSHVARPAAFGDAP